MQKYLLTQTLLGAYLYIFEAQEGYQEEAYKSFLDTLNRKVTPTNEVQQRGIDFENSVLEFTKQQEKKYSEDVIEIGKIVKGGQWQVKAYKDKTIGELTFLLYAKCDVVKCGTIYDIKRVSQYEVGKYQNSPQHLMYLECVPTAREFIYLISDGKDVYQERYTRQETMSIDEIIKDFINFLKDENLLNTYLEKWSA